ncbi:class I SAM-dependent methyltransferase [Streptococcus oralis]|uniref:class I SAM-dependent methyltransferase n=1 Tax=Streptococcus oralis TaxID=1303 RepID=UPI002024303E|nr:class I SAM-dependent methyltransferase [Streptococcus oralis]URK68214.1 class I SAM-dependent methyltransferase [Streptococcus oralis]
MDDKVIEQYKNHDNLDIRVELHKKYSKNKLGFNNWIFSNYQITDEVKVLELGCGTGELWKSNSDSIDKMKQLVVTDFSKDMVKTTKSVIGNRDNVNYEIIDIQKISFENETFDIVIANMLLHHVNNIPKALSEVNRVLKTGGIFYCATFGENGVVDYLASLFKDEVNQDLENKTFTLQNGKRYLRRYFNSVDTLLYDDELQVTSIDDLVKYIQSFKGISEIGSLEEKVIRKRLEIHFQKGKLIIPKEYGMFIARKEN